MTKSLNKRTISVGVLLATIFAGLTCCTKVDDHLGLDFIPPYQTLQVELDTISVGLNTYLTYSDSIPSNNIGFTYLGSLNSKTFGRTKVGALVQYLPTYRSDTLETGGVGEKADSVWLVGNFHYVAGDTMRNQIFNVFEVKGNLNNDSTYYTSFNAIDYIDPTPLFTFEMKGMPKYNQYDTLVLKVADQNKADDFLDRLMNMEKPYYLSDSLWLTKLQGLYFAPADNSIKNAAIYSMGLGFDENDSYLALFSHNYDAQYPTIPQDTILRYYTFYDEVDYSRTVSLTTVEHDYTGTGLTPVKDGSESLGTPTAKVGVQGFAGVTTTLEFDENFMEALTALIPEGYNVMVNKAKLILPTAFRIPELYDAAPERIGAYEKYSTKEGIVDYNWYYENEYGGGINYGGYLNRSLGVYEADLASYIQRMLNSEEKNPRITFGMTAYNIFSGGEIELSGTGGERPVQLALTYTLYKKSNQK